MDIADAKEIYVQSPETDLIIDHIDKFVSLLGAIQVVARELEGCPQRLLIGFNMATGKMEVEWNSYRDVDAQVQKIDSLIKRIHEERAIGQKLILELETEMNRRLDSSATGS